MNVPTASQKRLVIVGATRMVGKYTLRYALEDWLGALVLANPTKEKIRRVMNVVYRRGQKSRILPMTGDGNPVAFVTQSSKSSYKAVIVSPEQAFRIMVELKDPYRTLVFS